MSTMSESGGARRRRVVLEVTVCNHPGVMVHVCSLFSRRRYNMEGILCMPTDEGLESRIWILVDEDRQLEQVEQQLLKLEDVKQVGRRGAGHDLFVRLEALFATTAGNAMDGA